MKIGHITGIVISGTLWLIIGMLLSFKGFIYMAHCLATYEIKSIDYPCLKYLQGYLNNAQKAAFYLIFFSVFLGYMKAKLVLSKSVRRNALRLLDMQPPFHIKNLFSLNFLILIGCMFLLGMIFRVLPIYLDVKAFVDIAVGFSLIYGSILYFKYILALKMERSGEK